MAINWGLANTGGAQNALMNGFQLGQNIKQNALKEQQVNAALEQRQQAAAAKQQADAREQMRQRLQDTAKLFDGVTPENYGERVRIAQQMGIDVSQVPQAFDPAWVQQQGQIARFFADQPDLLTETAKNVMLTLPPEQRDPGHPAFRKAMDRALLRVSSVAPGGSSVGSSPNRDPYYVVGGPPGGQSGQGVPQQTKQIGGMTYYQDEAGDWYEGGGASDGTGGFP